MHNRRHPVRPTPLSDIKATSAAQSVADNKRCDISEQSVSLPHATKEKKKKENNHLSTPKQAPHCSLLSNTQRVQMSQSRQRWPPFHPLDGCFMQSVNPSLQKTGIWSKSELWGGVYGALWRIRGCNLQDGGCQRPSVEGITDDKVTPHAEVSQRRPKWIQTRTIKRPSNQAAVVVAQKVVRGCEKSRNN